MVRAHAVLVALLAAVGCAPSPVEMAFGELTVRVEASPARLVVYGPGRVALLDGRPGRELGASDAPNVAAAFRTTTADWSELYGSFMVDEGRGRWASVDFDNMRRDGATLRWDLDGGGSGLAQADGESVQITMTRPGVDRATAAFRCSPGEHFIGFGAQTADVDQRGQTVPIWVSEQGIGKVDTDEPAPDWFLRGTRHQTYAPVPFFVSSRGYGVEADSTRRSLFALCSEADDAWRLESWEGTLSLHVDYGATPLDVIRRHSERVGRPPAPPDWTWSPWNDAIMGSDAVRGVVASLRQNHIPSSVIWTEDWAGATTNGDNYALNYNWSVDRTLYPDAEQVAADLHAAGFKWLGYFNTFVESDALHYPEAVAGGFTIKKDGAPYLFDGARFVQTTLVDLSNSAARDWMAGYMSRALDVGFDGWMADFGEWLPVDAELASGESGDAAHNHYPVDWQQLNERVLSTRGGPGPCAACDQLQTFVRSAFTGSQKVTHQVMWGGDQNTEFTADDGLPTVVPIGIGLGVTGMPYFGSDIAGYQTAPMHPPSTKELFFRWVELGALSPIMRTHHGVAPALEWRFDRDADTLAHYGRWARLHQRLFPYLAAAAADAAATGAPMMRALALGFPGDDAAWSIKDEFLLGPSLLVAPVMVDMARTRDVYLPAGRWLPLSDAGPAAGVDGGGMMTVNAPLTELPLYGAAGTVLVLLPETVETLATPITDNAREVWALLGASGAATDPSAGGAMYTLTSTGAPAGVALTWQGAALSACADPPVAPCGQITGATATAQVIGPGTLAVDSAQLTVPDARPLTLKLAW